MLSVTVPGQPFWSYKVFHSLWLPVLGVGVHGQDQGANQGWLPPTPSLGEGHQRAPSILSYASAFLCLHLPAVIEKTLGGTRVA